MFGVVACLGAGCTLATVSLSALVVFVAAVISESTGRFL